MKIDLHVHSEYSKRPSNWLLKKVGCAESYTDPIFLYEFALQRGMNAVTITDHNTIEGCRRISHLPDTFNSCEVTTYFPEDGCKIHVPVYRISEAQFSEIERLRENVYELAAYLQQEKILHSLAHPFYKVVDGFDLEHFERCLLLFRYFEINGDSEQRSHSFLRQILESLTEEDINVLADKYGIEPAFENPWEKRYIGGSDDHSSLSMCCTYTEVEGAKTVDEFFEGIENNNISIHCPHPATPKMFAHNIYGVAYQFYNNKFNIGRHHERSVLIRFIDRMLQTRPARDSRLWNRMVYYWKKRKNRKPREAGEATVTELLQYEGQKLIESDPHMKKMLQTGHWSHKEPDEHWFRFLNEISNKMLNHLGSHIVRQLSGGNPFDLFHTLGSGGAFYTLLAPYFVSYTIYSSNRRFAEQTAGAFGVKSEFNGDRLSVGHFTDTFHEINGVARMLQEELMMAKKMGKDLTLITCPNTPEMKKNTPGVRYFDPVAVHSLPEYPEVKMAVPPLLKMMAFCYEQEFSHIHAATPGPLGLCAVATARVLKLPLYTTYHTSIPQYARYLTDDSAIEGLAWRYILWFYDQADVIFSPSRATGDELVSKGISAEKIRIIPRGVDTAMFSPDNRCDQLKLPRGRKLLYLGRVSKEKDLPLLASAFKKLAVKYPDVHLIVVGDGPYLAEMKEEMTGYNCVFTGYLKGQMLKAVYAECDLFVFPSTTDTFGNVVLEAQASGLAIVVSDMGGPCENLIPGQTGLVFRGGDEQGFFDAVDSLLNDPEKLGKMGKRAYDYASGRDFHKAFGDYWNLYKTADKYDTKHRNISEIWVNGMRNPQKAGSAE